MADDPYLDPETGILRNLVGARTQEALARIEADLTGERMFDIRLGLHEVKPTGDLRELQALHRHIFQDVYPWAGELRTINMSRPGGPAFQPPEVLREGCEAVFAQLAQDKFLQGMDRGPFLDSLTQNYHRLNALHPFREGNGRTQRLFWTRISESAGWKLDWRGVSKSENNEASRIARASKDGRPLRAMFDKIVSPMTARDRSHQAAFGAPAHGKGRGAAEGRQGRDYRPPAAKPDRGYGRG